MKPLPTFHLARSFLLMQITPISKRSNAINNDANNPTKVSETLLFLIFQATVHANASCLRADTILAEYAPILEDVMNNLCKRSSKEPRSNNSLLISSLILTFTGQYKSSRRHYTWDQDSYTFAKR